jgi:hypothetical protein
MPPGDVPASSAPGPRDNRTNVFGAAGCVVGAVAFLAFRAATQTGKGGEVIPLALALLAGSLAVLLAVFGWVRGRRGRSERVSVLFSAALGLAGTALVVFGWPPIAQQRMGRQPCASNLRQIGQALLLYSMDHGGRLPDRLQDLTTGTDSLTRQALICADGPDRPGQVSYDYLGAGRQYEDFGPDDIVAFEPPHNHDSDGGYALFGDGHVAFVFPATNLRDDVARVRTMLTTRPATTVPTAPRR